MKKISTLFKKDPNDLGRVINGVNPENEWVIKGEGVATRKFDGTAAAIINGELYRRYDVKKGKSVPPDAIPCQEPDLITGHWPHWVKCDKGNKEDKYFFEGFNNLIKDSIQFYYPLADTALDGTYELCGPKVQGNPENFDSHRLVNHKYSNVVVPDKLTFENIKTLLTHFDIEGIVFHHPDGRMCKIRKSDFGIKR